MPYNSMANNSWNSPLASNEEQFELSAHDICRQSCTLGYSPVRFQQMLSEQGALATARTLLASNRFQDGFRDFGN